MFPTSATAVVLPAHSARIALETPRARGGMASALCECMSNQQTWSSCLPSFPKRRVALLVGPLILAASVGTRAHAQDVPVVDATAHLSHTVGVLRLAEGDDGGEDVALTQDNRLELRFRFLGRAGFAIDAGAGFLADWIALTVGGGPRARLTPLSSRVDLDVGYDLRFMRLRELELIDFGYSTPQTETTLAHAVTFRLEGRGTPRGKLRVGAVLEIGATHELDRMWATLGLSVGIGNSAVYMPPSGDPAAL